MPVTLMRSKLFVPGSRPDRFDKALASGADAVSFDLEDAVLPGDRPQARQQVARFLRGLVATDAGVARPLLVVRVNAPGSDDCVDDLEAILQPALDLINIPKVDGPADVLRAVALLEAAEARHRCTRAVPLLVNIETPQALVQAAAIAAAHPRVAGLQLGLADLFEPLGVDRRDAANVHAAMFAVRMAAAAAGVAAWDAAWPDLQDLEGCRREALQARRLGYAGKSCVHPRQVAVANEVFVIDPDELAAARRIVEAARQHAGQGAFAVDGRMIDAPYLRRAQAVVQAAQAAAPQARAGGAQDAAP